MHASDDVDKALNRLFVTHNIHVIVTVPFAQAKHILEAEKLVQLRKKTGLGLSCWRVVSLHLRKKKGERSAFPLFFGGETVWSPSCLNNSGDTVMPPLLL